MEILAKCVGCRSTCLDSCVVQATKIRARRQLSAMTATAERELQQSIPMQRMAVVCRPAKKTVNPSARDYENREIEML